MVRDLWPALGLAALLGACDDGASGSSPDAGRADATRSPTPRSPTLRLPTLRLPTRAGPIPRRSSPGSSPDPDAPAYAFARWETEDWSLMDPTAGLYLQKVLRHYTTAPPEVVAHFETARAAIPTLATGDDPVLSFSGDVLWVGDNWADFGRAAGPRRRRICGSPTWRRWWPWTSRWGRAACPSASTRRPSSSTGCPSTCSSSTTTTRWTWTTRGPSRRKP
ncbi:MAG: hypothetical protein R3F43_09685 [bacterium]